MRGRRPRRHAGVARTNREVQRAHARALHEPHLVAERAEREGIRAVSYSLDRRGAESLLRVEPGEAVEDVGLQRVVLRALRTVPDARAGRLFETRISVLIRRHPE